MRRDIPDVVLERYRLHELPDASMRAIDAMRAADPALRERLAELERSDADIVRRYPTREFIHDVPARSRRTVLRFAMATALAVAALVTAVVLPRKPAPAPATDRIKGSPSLAVYRRTTAGSERLADGDVARAGDLLRVGYVSAGRPYGIILSIDGRGAVTMHLPSSGDRAVQLTQGTVVLLDRAYELDDAPRIERFYFVTGAQPFATQPIVDAARTAGAAAGALRLPAGLDQVTFTVQKKEARP